MKSLFKSRWQPHRLRAYMPAAVRCLLLKGLVYLHHIHSSNTKVSTSPSHRRALCLLLTVPCSQAGENLPTKHPIELELSYFLDLGFFGVKYWKKKMFYTFNKTRFCPCLISPILCTFGLWWDKLPGRDLPLCSYFLM